MDPPRLQVGIDFSQKQADICVLQNNGQPVELHQRCGNNQTGYAQAKRLILAALDQYGQSGIDLGGEATGNYWLPFYLCLAEDTELAAHDLRLYLLNPLWVHWYKKSLPQDDKTDHKDPYYIADRIRTHPPKVAWRPDWEWLALRTYTRLRFYLMQQLSSEKNFFQAHLFVLYSSYATTRPFSNLFGRTSQQVLSYAPDLADLLALDADPLRSQLAEWSQGNLFHPDENMRKLHRVVQESFPLDPRLAKALRPMLKLLFENIRFLEGQVAQVEEWIASEAAQHPEVAILAAIPGLGPVTSAGITAEVGSLQRFFAGQKWNKRQRAYRPKDLRDVEDAVAKYAGLWWPRSASGDFEAEERHLSKRGNRYLRYYLVEAADHMRRWIPSYQTFYKTKFHQATKHKHKRALILTARKSVGLFVGLLHRMEAYTPEVKNS